METREQLLSKNEVFDQEILPHYHYLYSYALKSTLDPDFAKDILQDVYTQAFQHLDTYQAGTNSLAWMFRILKNILIKEYHLTKSRGMMVQMEYLEAENAGLLKLSYYEPSFQSGDVGDELVTAFNTLNAKFKEVLILHDIHGYDYVEISRIIKIPLGTVRSRLHRARKELRSKLPVQNFKMNQIE